MQRDIPCLINELRQADIPESEARKLLRKSIRGVYVSQRCHVSLTFKIAFRTYNFLLSDMGLAPWIRAVMTENDKADPKSATSYVSCIYNFYSTSDYPYSAKLHGWNSAWAASSFDGDWIILEGGTEGSAGMVIFSHEKDCALYMLAFNKALSAAL